MTHSDRTDGHGMMEYVDPDTGWHVSRTPDPDDEAPHRVKEVITHPTSGRRYERWLDEPEGDRPDVTAATAPSLYRGLLLRNDRRTVLGTQWLESSVQWGMTSFTSDPAVAVAYAGRQGSGGTPVLFELAAGSRSIMIENLSECWEDREWLSRGLFRFPSLDVSGPWIRIGLRHHDPMTSDTLHDGPGSFARDSESQELSRRIHETRTWTGYIDLLIRFRVPEERALAMAGMVRLANPERFEGAWERS